MQVANIPAVITCTDVMAGQHAELVVTFMKGMRSHDWSGRVGRPSGWGAPATYPSAESKPLTPREPEPEGPLVQFLETRIADRPMDLAATIGGPPEAARAGSLAGRATQVTVPWNPAGMVEDILQLQPQTTNTPARHSRNQRVLTADGHGWTQIRQRPSR